MWKKFLAFSCMLTLVILLNPTLTPAQPGFGKGKKRDGEFPGGTSAFPGGTNPGLGHFCCLAELVP